MQRRLVLIVALSALMSVAFGCPFCAPMPGVMTAQRIFEESAFVGLAIPAPPSDELSAAGARFSVTVPLKGKGLQVGQTVKHRRNLVLGDDRVYLLQGETADLSTSKVRAIPDEVAEFLKAVAQLPSRKKTGPDQLTRLTFFARHLGERNALIAASVTDEFSATDYAVVKQMRSLSLEDLVRRLENTDGTRAHDGLLYLLVGLEGSAAAKAQLATWLDSMERTDRVGFDGLIGAYLYLHGDKGLARVAGLIPDLTGKVVRRRWVAVALAKALDFHGRLEQVLTRPSLLSVLHRLLADDEAVSPAIDTLMALEAWDSWELVVATRARALEKSSVERATRTFLLACPIPAAKSALNAR